MQETGNRIFKLYALSVTPENVEQAVGSRFSRILPEYILIYTDGAAPERSVEVTQENLYRLTKEDQSWIMECAGDLLMERLEKEKPAVAKRLSDMIDALGAALDEEREKLSRIEGEKTDGNTDSGTEQSPV